MMRCLVHPYHHMRRRTYIWGLTLTPSASPEMTATVTPPWLGLGTSLLLISWYCGSTIFSAALRFTHSWRPRTGSSDTGISAWTTPRPAVIHCPHRQTLALRPGTHQPSPDWQTPCPHRTSHGRWQSNSTQQHLTVEGLHLLLCGKLKYDLLAWFNTEMKTC